MSLNNNKTDTKDVLYSLMISQLLHDGHQDVARMIQKKEGMKKILLPSNKLKGILDHHLKNFPEDFCDEDDLIVKHSEEIRAEVSKMFKRRKFDREMMVSIILEQIKLVGSKKMYDKVSRFPPGETYFLKDQMKLYQWREKFFQDNFPDGSWYTDGGDDAHDYDTVPFQITSNFDEVVADACKPGDGKVFFENDERSSAASRDAFDLDWVKYKYEFHDYDEKPFEKYQNPGEALTVIASLFQSQPFKLEYYALKKCMEHDLDVQSLPEKLHQKTFLGFYENCSEIEDYVDPDGKKLFDEVKEHYKDWVKGMKTKKLKVGSRFY